MADRRALIEGLSDEARAREKQFVYNQPAFPADKTAPASPPKSAPTAEELPPSSLASVAAASQISPSSALTGVGRVPVGARVRTELAGALKRASLERQLRGTQPHAVQEILEEAIQLWLMKNGHSLK